MSPAAIKAYFNGPHDYYIDGVESPGIWGGNLATELGLSGQVEREAFHNMADGLHPTTGQKLKPGKDGERSANDITISAPKEVTLLYVRLAQTDPKKAAELLKAFNESCDWIMGKMEKEAAVRTREDGKRVEVPTGNWAWVGFVHFEARPDSYSKLPDPQLHRHHVVFNMTRDPDAQREIWSDGKPTGAIKALDLGFVKGNADLYMPAFHNDLARKMRDLGYGIERKGTVGFGITGIPRELVERFSKRRITIQKAHDAIAKAEGITDPERLRRLKAELGVLTRKHKQKDLSREELWKFWNSQLTNKDRAVLDRARSQKGWQCTNHDALQYGLDHHLERSSVVPEKKVLAAALNYGVGSVDLASLKAEYSNLGVLVKNGEVTTQAVLDQEGRIIDFAREGKGTMRPLAGEIRDLGYPVGSAQGHLSPSNSRKADTTMPAIKEQATSQSSRSGIFGVKLGKKGENLPARENLSAEQQVLFDHVMASTDQVALVVADAGTGKTSTSKPIVAEIVRQTGKHVEMLAPSASASRGTLREEGFNKADTVASFLQSSERQRAVKNGVIWVDESSLLAINDLEKLCGIARAQNARIVIQGDPKQHRSVARDGNMMKVLEEYAGIKPGRLTEIWRQKNKAYKEAVAAIAKGDILGGHEKLEAMGAVKRDGVAALVSDYMDACDRGRSVLVVCPTHKEAESVTLAIRGARRERGDLGEDVVVPVLRPLHWTEAQKGDRGQYRGDEVIQFHRNSGQYRAGERVAANSFLLDDGGLRSDHFSVFRKDTCHLASGDTIRITNNSWTQPNRFGFKHRLDNGSLYTVASVDGESKRVTLSNGWTINTPHLTDGYVSTSYGAQGKTIDICLAAMGQESLGAINAAQFYVTASRARHAFRLYTDLAPENLKDAIRRSDTRKSATETFKPKPKRQARNPHIDIRKRAQEFMRRLLIEQERSGIQPVIAQEKERNVYRER